MAKPLDCDKINWEEKFRSYPGNTIKEKLTLLKTKYSNKELSLMLGVSISVIQYLERRFFGRIKLKKHRNPQYNYLSELNTWKKTPEGKAFLLNKV